MKNLIIKLCMTGLLTISNSTAQNYLLQDIPAATTDIQLRFLHPAADNIRETTSFSGIYDLRLSFPVSDKVILVASLPYLSMEYENTFVTYMGYYAETPETRNGFANPLIGVRLRGERNNGQQTIGTVSISLPTISEDASRSAGIGIQADYHNFHRYLRKTTVLAGNVMSTWYRENGAHFEFEIGPRLMFMNGDEDTETEFLIHYGIGGSVPVSVLELRMELAGLLLLSAQTNEFSDKFNHTLAFGARYARGSFTPGVFYQVYLSDMMSDNVSGVLGVDFVYRF